MRERKEVGGGKAEEACHLQLIRFLQGHQHRHTTPGDWRPQDDTKDITPNTATTNSPSRAGRYCLK